MTDEIRLIILYVYLAVISILHANMLGRKAKRDNGKKGLYHLNIVLAVLWSACALLKLLEM